MTREPSPTKFSRLKLDILTKSSVSDFSTMRGQSWGFFCYTGLLPKRCRQDLNPFRNKIFAVETCAWVVASDNDDMTELLKNLEKKLDIAISKNLSAERGENSENAV